jgi:hypothetical protein
VSSEEFEKLVESCLIYSFLPPITSRITNTAKPSSHVSFHGLAKFWVENLSIAAWASHVLGQRNSKTLITINNYKLKTGGPIVDANGTLPSY